MLLATALIASTMPGDASAHPRIELSWRAPRPACPDEEEVQANLAAVLRRSERRDPIEVTATITERVDDAPTRSFRLHLRFRGGATGERTLRDESCEGLARSAVLAIAIVYDPFFVAPGPAVVPSPVEPPDAPAPKTAPAASPRMDPHEIPPLIAVPPSRRARRPRVRLRAELDADLGSLPGIAWGGGGVLGLRWPAWGLELGGRYLPPRRATLDERPSAGGELALGAGSVRGCAVPWSTRRTGSERRDISLLTCAGFEVGAVLAEGFGVDTPTESRSAWVAAEASGGAEFFLSRIFAVTLRFGLQIPLSRPSFLLNGTQLVYRPAPAGLGSRLGLEATF
ncbi:MAG: hypothetical protein AAGA56_28680 [Myxococcota bacterium]